MFLSQPQSDLLSTKLTPPPVREKRVVRLRLLERLDNMANQKFNSDLCAGWLWKDDPALPVDRTPWWTGWLDLPRPQ